MIIVKSEKSNLDELSELAIKLWPDNSWKLLRDEFEQFLESKNDKVYLAVVQDTYVGFIHMSIRSDYVEGSDSSPVGYIEGIYVDKDFRNRGVSRSLVEAGEQWAKSKGCTQIASDTEWNNYASQAFHKRIGFKEVGRIVAFIKDLD